MPTPLEKFQSLLRELFQFEHADLDFGVYRIMNLRRERMEKWLNEELPARARDILKQGGNTADDDIRERLQTLKAELLTLEPGGVDEDGNITKDFLKESTKGKEYLKVKALADRAPVRTVADMEPLVYNHLYDFFSRYYDSGDFIPKRRRSFAPDGRDTYAIPWDGEEVVLHWANKDQHYIKTSERFTHYRWQSDAGERTFTIEFRLTDADLPANNNKDAKKKFNLLIPDKVEWQDDNSTLILPFHYRGLTPEEEAQYTGTHETKLRENIITRTVERLRQLPVVTRVPQLETALMAPKRDAAGREKRDKDGNPVPLLPHHLNRWAVKNESDFFIHKDLRRFLLGELDYYLKSVVLNLDNLLAAGEQRAEPNFRLLEAVKRLGTEIVDFVSQLENFQKALFEKKKFILETSWCLTLDRIPASVKEEVYDAILANDRQWEEWEKLYKISQWPADFATVAPRTREFLEAYPYLILDTALGYASTIVESLLGAVNNLDAHMNGLIIHSENFQALSLLVAGHKSSVKCAYIDPPYNTGDDANFCYKDTFKSSTWLALLEGRLELAMELLTPDGYLASHIDENESETLRILMNSVFGSKSNLGTIIWDKRNPKGDAKKIAAQNEYIQLAIRDPRALGSNDALPLRRKKNAQKILDKCATLIADGSITSERREIFRKWVLDQDFTGGEKPYHLIDDSGDVYRTVSMAWPNKKKASDEYFEPLIHPITNQPCPVPERGWRNPPETMSELLQKGLIIFGADHTTQPTRKYLLKENMTESFPSILYFGGSADDYFTSIGLMFPDYPKPVEVAEEIIYCGGHKKDSLVVDFFGGSGTTGHAVINLNRADEGTRRYLLVEMGAYFDTVLKPRLQKVVFSEAWKDGVPQRKANGINPYNGISHCIKVLRLESYEDALDNIEFNSDAAPGSELGLDFRRDYELRYALDWESKDCPTRLAVEQLDTPFDYTLTLRRESGTVEVKPDLPETFAYLIGLHTRRRFRVERDGVSYLIYTGTLHADGTEVAVLWRTCRGWTEDMLKAEMDWWRMQRETLAPGATRVYVNGASAIEGHYSLDAEFKTRMHGGTV